MNDLPQTVRRIEKRLCLLASHMGATHATEPLEIATYEGGQFEDLRTIVRRVDTRLCLLAHHIGATHIGAPLKRKTNRQAVAMSKEQA